MGAESDTISLPFIIFESKKYDISKLVYKELLDLKMMVTVSYVDVDQKYTEARSMGHQHGIYSDPIWFSDTQRLRGIRKAQIECINIEIGERRRKHDMSEARVFEYWFLKAARKMLHPSGFAVIEDEARKMRKESEE
mgnify:CR=1 FL=1